MDAGDIGAFLYTTQGISPYLQGAYTILNRWYCHTSARQPNPLRADLEKVSRYYAAPYQREDLSPPGRPVPTHVTPFQIDDRFLKEAEAEAKFCLLRMNNSGVHMHLKD